MTSVSTYPNGRDAARDPQSGDEIGHRDKPIHEVRGTFVDACGTTWVNYVEHKQMTLKNWRRRMRGARVIA